MKNRIFSILLAVMLALSVGLIGCGGEPVPETTEYSLTISSTEGGSVTNPGEGVYTYDEGEVVDLVAEADEGYYFIYWTGDVGTIADVNDASTSITMNGDYEVTADFDAPPPLPYNLTVASTAGGDVITPGEGTFLYAAGKLVNLVATPASGYRFVNWSGDVNDIANVNAASTTIAMHGNYEIIANFEPIPPVRYSLTITSSAGGSVTTPGQGTFTYDAGMVVSMVAAPTGGYQFAGWTGDVGTMSCACQSTTITMNGNYSIMANFEVIPVTYYTLTIGVNGSGTTSPALGQHSYAAGTVVPITATPGSCSSFVNWTGNVGTVANVSASTTSIIVNGSYSIKANFAGEGEVVTFPDPNLEAAIREAIGKPTGCIYASELEGLTGFSAYSRNIHDLTGLEHCTGLIYLYLWSNQISDISPLANLTSLIDLDIWGNQISDISPLANLTNLAHLYMQVCQITDISPLANLTSLADLILHYNQISDISPLANLTNLLALSLVGNQISDISPLANLTRLEMLYLGQNQISDISPLGNLTNLRAVHLDRNQISNISPLVQNAGLATEEDYVDLYQNPLSSDSLSIYIPQLQSRGVRVFY